jgi:subtilisin family serine protease
MRLPVARLFMLIFMSFLINACGKQTTKTSGTQLSSNFCETSSNKANVQKSAIETTSQKVIFHNQPKSTLSKASSAVYLDKVSVRVDAQCLREDEQFDEFLGIILSDKNKSDLKKFFNFSLELDGISLQEIQDAAEANDCVVRVSDFGRVKKSQVQTSYSNDEKLNEQGHLFAMDYWPAYEYFFNENQIREDVRVAIVDTGILYTHPDLNCNMWPSIGRDLVNNDNDPIDDDAQGHGTHVAGIIGACGNNGIGGTGIMGDHIQLMAVKTLDNQGRGDIDVVANGIDWAVENGADIINLSLEAPGRIQLIRDAIQRAVRSGVVVLGAAGNEGVEVSDGYPVTPAIDSDIQGMISVGSVDSVNLQLSTFSNSGTAYVEIAATGSRYSQGSLDGIYSTSVSGGYVRISGTSQAAPVVAGGVALIIGFLKSRNITYSPANIETYLRVKGATQSASLEGRISGGALLNLRVLKEKLAEDYGNVTNSSFQVCP